MGEKQQQIIIDILTHVSQFVLFSSLEYSQSWVFSEAYVSLSTARCLSVT